MDRVLTVEGIKPYEELEFTDDFIFWKVMTTNRELCRQLLELILGVKIKKIEYAEGQKTMQFEPGNKGIRLDVYVDDEAGTVYDIDMQRTSGPYLIMRIRYYQSLIDMNMLEQGANYTELRKSFVIFICKNDLFDRDRSVYRFKNLCVDDPTLEMGDGTEKIILNAAGDRAGLSPDMVNFLDFLVDHTPKDSFTESLEDAVGIARDNPKWRTEYMKYEADRMDLIRKGREEGKAEGKAEGEAEQKAKDDKTIIDGIIGVMSSFHVTADKAMDSMNLSPEQKTRYAALMSETS